MKSLRNGYRSVQLRGSNAAQNLDFAGLLLRIDLSPVMNVEPVKQTK